LWNTPDELLDGIKTSIFPDNSIVEERKNGFGLVLEDKKDIRTLINNGYLKIIMIEFNRIVT
jgi:hypothetical protein